LNLKSLIILYKLYAGTLLVNDRDFLN